MHTIGIVFRYDRILVGFSIDQTKRTELEYFESCCRTSILYQLSRGACVSVVAEA